MSLWNRTRLASLGRPLVIGHRGTPTIALENTRESFRRAIAGGTDALETDVHLTADGQVVCLHDDNLLRIAGVPASIGQLTFEEARAHLPARCCHVKFLWPERPGARRYSGETGRNFPCIESFEAMVANCVCGSATRWNRETIAGR